MTQGALYYRSTCRDAPSRSWPYKAIWSELRAIWSELRALWSGYVCSYDTAYRALWSEYRALLSEYKALLSEYRALLSEYRERGGVYDAVEPLVMFWQCHRRTWRGAPPRHVTPPSLYSDKRALYSHKRGVQYSMLYGTSTYFLTKKPIILGRRVLHAVSQQHISWGSIVPSS